MGGLRGSTVKYHYFHRFLTNSVKRSLAASAALILALTLVFATGGSVLMTVSGGEFDWGGTFIKR